MRLGLRVPLAKQALGSELRLVDLLLGLQLRGQVRGLGHVEDELSREGLSSVQEVVDVLVHFNAIFLGKPHVLESKVFPVVRPDMGKVGVEVEGFLEHVVLDQAFCLGWGGARLGHYLGYNLEFLGL